jgi:imidazolonepropionase-like amidohydrolase
VIAPEPQPRSLEIDPAGTLRSHAIPPTPAGDRLARTGPDTLTYVVLNHGRPAGDMVVIREGDEAIVQWQYVDRNRGQWRENRFRMDEEGRIVAGQASPMERDGAVLERTEWFAVEGQSIRWTRGDDEGEARHGDGAIYRLGQRTPWADALLARHLLDRPDHRASILPTGNARALVAADTVAPTVWGDRRVRYVAVHGFGAAAGGVWLDEAGDLVATDAGWFITVREGWEGALPLFRDVEVAYRNSRGEELARRLAQPRSDIVVIRNGDLFHAETGRIRTRTTVVIRGDRIAEVGPTGAVHEPPGARVIDATGQMILPGLWDMHTHLHFSAQESSSLSRMAFGVTTMRDLAADLDAALDHRRRAEREEIVSPRVILGGFVEGPGAWAGPSEVIVVNEEEARSWVAHYHALGYRQIKLYNLVHPDLVPVFAREARDRGMLLSGHVPRGMSVHAAVRLGFDEINHAAFLFSTFFPDSLYVPDMRPYSGVAQAVAGSFDVDGPEMTELIRLLAGHGTIVDGTFRLWMGPGAVRGEETPTSRAYSRLIARLWEAGVTLVPGTDAGSGMALHEELRLYVMAGIPAPEVLRMATLGSAEVMGEEADYGSIVPGKVADIILVEGRPHERIEELERITHVIRAGRIYDPAAIRAALQPDLDELF